MTWVLLSQWRVRVLLVACLIGPAGFVAVVQPTEFAALRHHLRPLDERHRLGRAAGDPRFRRPLRASAADLADRRRRVRRGGPSGYLAPLAGGGPLVPADLRRGEDAGQPHCHRAAGGGAGCFRHRRRARLGRGQPLVGLDGHLLSSGAAAGKVLLAWICVLAPTFALGAIGLLGSVAFGRLPMGLLLPVLVALAMDVAQLLPLPIAVRIALPSYGFIAWIGLFTDPVQLGPLLISSVVSLIRPCPARWPTCCSCGATSPTPPTTAPGRRALICWGPAAGRGAPGDGRRDHLVGPAGGFGHRPGQDSASVLLPRSPTCTGYRPARCTTRTSPSRSWAAAACTKGTGRGRSGRSGERLALRHRVASSRRRGPWICRLRTRCQLGRAIPGGRRRTNSGERVFHGAYHHRRRTEPAVAIRRQRRSAQLVRLVPAHGEQHAIGELLGGSPAAACQRTARSVRPLAVLLA